MQFLSTNLREGEKGDILRCRQKKPSEKTILPPNLKPSSICLSAKPTWGKLGKTWGYGVIQEADKILRDIKPKKSNTKDQARKKGYNNFQSLSANLREGDLGDIRCGKKKPKKKLPPPL